MLILTVLRDNFWTFCVLKKSYFGLFQSCFGFIYEVFEHFFRSCHFWLYFKPNSWINEIKNLNVRTIFESITPCSNLSFGVLQSSRNVRQDFLGLFILNWLIFSGGILSKNGFHLRTGQKYNYNNYDLKESNTLRDIT